MMIPVLPTTLWLTAAAFLILLLLVVFGYHLYQRSRLAALAKEAGGIGELAAQKERLEADTAELRAWLTSQRGELQSLEAERHKQELLRADLAQLERVIENRKKDSESNLKYASDLDVMIVRKRNLLNRLETEIKALEARKFELEPMDQSVKALRAELENGKIKAALLAEQELKTANLQQLAYALGREIEELQRTLEPLRHEKNRLHLFIEQARHASSVKNERILEQNEQIRNLEINRGELIRQTEELASQLAAMRAEETAAKKKLDDMEESTRNAMQTLLSDNRELEERAVQLEDAIKGEQEKLADITRRKDQMDDEVMRLTARKALLEATDAPMIASRRRRKTMHRPALFSPSGISARARPQKRVQQVFCDPGA